MVDMVRTSMSHLCVRRGLARQAGRHFLGWLTERQREQFAQLQRRVEAISN